MTAQEQSSPAGEESRRKPLLTVNDVASFLNVSEAYVYELAKRKQIPRGKIGRLYRFEEAEVEAWWKLRKKA